MASARTASWSSAGYSICSSVSPCGAIGPVEPSRSGAAIFPANQSRERLPIPTCTQPLTRSAPYCVQTRRRRSRSRRGPIPRSAYGTAPHRHAVVDKRPLRYATPIRGLHLAYGGAARIWGGERAEIVQADRHRSGFVHGFEVKFIVDMQYEVSGTGSTSLDLSAIRYT